MKNQIKHIIYGMIASAGLLVGIWSLFLPISTHAATHTVTNNLDAGAGSLRQAIADANEIPGEDTISFDPSLVGQTIELTTGPVIISDDLNIAGLGSKSLTVRGDSINVIFYLENGASLYLEGITLEQAGQAIVASNGAKLHLSNSVIRDSGTGLFQAPSSTSLITNTLLTGHSSGAIVADTADGEIHDSQIISNSAVHGGGIHLVGPSTWLIEDSVIAENSADQEGGGVLVENGAGLYVARSNILSNTAGFGAGLANLTGTIQIKNSVIAWNKAITGGGGLYEFSLSSMAITNTLVQGNEAAWGGGLYLDHGSVSIDSSTFYDNWALGGVLGMEGVGGGIYAGSGRTALDSVVSLANSTLSGNHATWNGGAIGMGEADFVLRNVTIFGNEVDFDASGVGDGGGLAQYGKSTVQLDNIIIAGNNDAGGQSPDCAIISPSGAGITSVGYNLIEDTAGCPVTPTVGDLFDQSSFLDGNLRNNGGQTPTHALLPASPAIDAGNCSGWLIRQDQRGIARGVVSACDIGAYEVGFSVQLPLIIR